jgi:hypothetical protein
LQGCVARLRCKVALHGCVIVALKGCVIVALQGCIIVALQGCEIVALQGCMIAQCYYKNIAPPSGLPSNNNEVIIRACEALSARGLKNGYNHFGFSFG